MEFFETISRRQSIRKFLDRPIDASQLHAILDTANHAPSAGNLQAYEISVVQQPSVRQRLDAATGDQGAIREAPVVLVFCAVPQRSHERYGARGEQLFCVQDATIACAYAQLAATALGLSSVWIGAVHEPEVVKEALGLEAGMWPIAFLPIGYPAEVPLPKPRRPLDELVRTLS